jgi:triphosphoribosyl-dephospho-CoA synthetase
MGDARANAALAGTNTLTLLIEGPGEGSLEEPAVIQAIAGLEDRIEARRERRHRHVLRRRAAAHASHAERRHVRTPGDLPATKRLAAQYLFLYGLSGGSDSLDTMLTAAHDRAKVRFLTQCDSTRTAIT